MGAEKLADYLAIHVDHAAVNLLQPRFQWRHVAGAPSPQEVALGACLGAWRRF